MAALKKATVYIDPEIHKALRLKAAETDSSVSDVLNESLRASLLEDADDLKAIRERKKEATMSYEKMLAKLKADGRL